MISLPAYAGGVSSNAKSQIRKFYDEANRAFQTTSGGLKFLESHNYPNAFLQKSKQWATAKQEWNSSGITQTITPDMNTVDIDSKWKLSKGLCNPAMKSPPKGTTYKLAVEVKLRYKTGSPETYNANVHLTILNAKVFFYYPICSESTGQDSTSTDSNEPAITTLTLPSFVGHTQADVDTWKRQNALQIQIHYSTAMGYNYTVSCQMQGRGVVLKQNPMAGSQVADSLGTVIWLDIDC